MTMTMRAAIYSTAEDESHGDGGGEKWRLRWYITINVGGGRLSKADGRWMQQRTKAMDNDIRLIYPAAL